MNEELKKAIAELDEELNKAATGEGSRGGKVTGHTRSGKPIYQAGDKVKVLAQATPHGKEEQGHVVSSKDFNGEMRHLVSHPYEDAGRRMEAQPNNGRWYADKDLQKSEDELEKKQGVPEGVDPAKHERCIKDVKAQGHSKESAFASCNASMKKSQEEEEMEELLKTVKALGKDKLKKALPGLSIKQKELLIQALKKGADITKEAQMSDNKKPQKAREPLTEERSNSEEGVDEADEKLMKPANAEQKHQGGSHQLPEGWKGEVVKSENREEIKEKIMEAEEKEHHSKNPKKVMEGYKEEHEEEKEEKEEGKEPKMEKSEMLKKMVERMKARGMHREKCMDMLKKKGFDADMASQHWPEEKKEAEEKESPMGEMDSKEEEKKPESKEKPEMKKSIQWGNPNQKIMAFAKGRGQNAHYNVADQIASDHEKLEALKKSEVRGYLGEAEELKKSENKTQSVTDLIEKGLDCTQDRYESIQSLRKSKPQGAYTVASFSEEDMLKAMNPTERAAIEKAKK